MLIHAGFAQAVERGILADYRGNRAGAGRGALQRLGAEDPLRTGTAEHLRDDATKIDRVLEGIVEDRVHCTRTGGSILSRCGEPWHSAETLRVRNWSAQEFKKVVKGSPGAGPG